MCTYADELITAKSDVDYTSNMTKALRGINLGGWLVAERWMTPQLFSGVSGSGELAIGRELGSETARERLNAHRAEFITEKDFNIIKKAGFDFVRLPIGYWLFDGTDDFIDGEVYIDKAFEWAGKHKLGIVLDFHGLQGSQNGYDHSGQVGKIRLYRGGNQQRALGTLRYMCQKYGDDPSLIAIELINEPKVRWFLWRVLRYYDKAYRVASQYVAPGVKIIVSDAFKPLRMAKALSKRGYGDNLVLDVHLYQVFDRDARKTPFTKRIQIVESNWYPMIEEIQRYIPVFVGEWSAALMQEAYMLEETTENDFVYKYYQTQKRLFDKMSWAHCYWSYKAPNWGVWSWIDAKDVLEKKS